MAASLDSPIAGDCRASLEVEIPSDVALHRDASSSSCGASAQLLAFSAAPADAQRARRAHRGALERHPARQRRRSGEARPRHAPTSTRRASSSRCATKARASTSTPARVDPTTPDNLEREDGRGLFLMRKLMDRVERVRRRAARQRRSPDARSRMSELARGARRVSRRHALRGGRVGADGADGTTPLSRRRRGDDSADRRRFPPLGDGIRDGRPRRGRRARRRRPRPAPRLARARPVPDRAASSSSSYMRFLLPVVDAVPPVRARGRARGERARRALRGDQSPLHDQRDPRPHRVARGSGADDPHARSRRRSARGARRSSCTIRETDTLRAVAALGADARATSRRSASTTRAA